MLSKIKKINEYQLWEFVSCVFNNENPADIEYKPARRFLPRLQNVDAYLNQITKYVYGFTGTTDPVEYTRVSHLFYLQQPGDVLKVQDERINLVLTLFINRNWNNYCIKYEYYSNPCETVNVTLSDLYVAFTNFWNNVLSILEMTWEKYCKILDFYADKKDDLLNQLERTIEGSNENKSYINLTPQTAQEGENMFGYINRADKNTGTDSTTTKEDRDFLISRIDEISRKYELVMKDWCHELDRLCWESD